MTAQELRDLLDWWMCSDPFPLGDEQHTRIERWLNKWCSLFGYSEGWAVAYHKHMKPKAGDEA